MLPDLGCEPHDGRFFTGELEVRKFSLVAPDAIADLIVEVGVVATGLHRDAELAELFLVALEHPIKRISARCVTVVDDGVPDLDLGEELFAHQERKDEVHQPLGLALGHERRMSGSVEQVDREDQRVAGLDVFTAAFLTVRNVGRAHQHDTAADLLAHELVGPALDELPLSKLER